jgi:polyphosphate kinase
MKKLILLSVACFLFAGSQLSFAQTKVDSQIQSSSSTIQNSPKEKTNQIANMLERTNKLDTNQKEKIYEIFTSMEKKMIGIEAVKDASSKNAKRAKMNAYINSKLKTVLTDEQFSIYLKNTSAK